MLVADITNTTGEPLLDGTLRTAISAALAQSRHVRVFDRGRMVETLRRMKRDPGALVDEGLGREICLREGVDVLLTGQIQRSGNTLELGAQGIRPQSGEVIFAEQERFKDRGQLFDRVDALARRVRGRLGESEAVVQAASRPLSQVTTASLEALERYSRGRDLGFLDNLPAAKALFEDAVRIDPGFALAHLELGMALDIQGESGDEHYARAYALASETTDRERHFITAVYESSLGHYEDAVRSLQVLVSLYPDDLRAHHQLALALESAGQADRAIVELQKIVALDRGDAHYCGNLLLLLAVAGREEEVRREYAAARGRGLTAPYLEWGFGLAQLGAGHPDEALVSFERMANADPPLSAYGRRLLAQTALYRGQWASAERQLQSLIDAGPSPADKLRLRLLRSQLHQAQKRQDQAVAETDQALGEAPATIVQATDLRVAGTIWARAHDLARARRALARLESASPGHPSLFDRICILSLKGEIAAASGDGAEAARLFAAAWSEYPQPEAAMGQALALAAARDWANAARAWEQVLSARGLILRSGFGSEIALAYRGRAAALARAGDGPAARKSYAEFLRIWKEADADVLRAFRIEDLDGGP